MKYKSFLHYINNRYDRKRMIVFTAVHVVCIASLWFSNKTFFASCLAVNYLFFAGMFLLVNYIAWKKYIS